MANRLADEKSPYLLQHAENPVDWYAWGSEALDHAVREDKPILVSIGYSACHWCHVMEHESFEDEATARLMNENFVNIKVDREERPDVDAIYMEAVQALTGSGGWPLNVFLTPDGRPFYGGTYFPPHSRQGMPSWPQVLTSISAAYRQQRGDVLKNAAALTQYVREAQKLPQSQEPLSPDLLTNAYSQIEKQLDWTYGGFGGAPKFPQPLALEYLLRMHKRSGDERPLEFVELTLRRMAEGGLFDQLGGGFHRYTVDAAWVVPHFEKMLYDNALLASTYVHVYQLSGDAWFRSIAEKTLDYLLRDMRSTDGGFYSSQDADSEGVEGRYYVWTPQEIEQLFSPDDAEIVSLRYGITPSGNFEGKTILTNSTPLDQISQRTGRSVDEVTDSLRRAEVRLLDLRSQRAAPGKDTKILASWNALAIRALAESGRILGREDYLEAAVQGADFIANHMCPHGQLARSYKDGPGNVPAFLEDYAYLVEALVTLYETTFDADYLRRARELAEEMVRRFWDDEQGGFYDVQAGADDLVVRPRSFFDNPIPAGNSSASLALLHLEALTGESAYRSWAVTTFRTVRDALSRMPLGFAYSLCGLDFYLAGATQVAIVGDPKRSDTRQLVAVVQQHYLPNAVVAVGEGDGVPLLANRRRIDDAATAFVCRQFSCRRPVTDSTELMKQLELAAT